MSTLRQVSNAGDPRMKGKTAEGNGVENRKPGRNV